MRKKIVSLVSLLIFLSTIVLAQTKTITGKIKDEKDGNPLAGVSIVVKGTSTGTTTASDGTFTLTVPVSAKILIISSLNYESKEVSVGKGAINVSLTSSEAASLKEVVVTVPYGTVKKSTFTGSAGTVTAATIQKQQVTSVTRVLEGLVPGVSTTNGGGAPGSEGSGIRIRGFGSINASSAPLIVLNGVPYDGSIAAISNDEIESVDVLKDAAASNLYGSRAANGVIMITTKKGKKGPATIQAAIRHGISTRGIPEYDRVSIPEYYELYWEALKNTLTYENYLSPAQAGQTASSILTGAGNGLGYNAYNVPGNQLINSGTGKINPNAKLLWDDSWSDAIFRDAGRTNINLNISGASDRSTYFISGGYLKEQGIAKFSEYERFNFRTDITTQANDWLKAGIGFDGASDKRIGVFSGGSTVNPFSYTRGIGPIYPVYQRNTSTGDLILDDNGQPRLDWGGSNYGPNTKMGDRPQSWNGSNILGVLALDENNRRRLNGNFNTFAEIAFLKDFTFKTTVGLNFFQTNNVTYQNNEFGDAANVKGRLSQASAQSLSITANQVLSWNKTIGKHNIRALAGHENYQYKERFLSATKTGFSFPRTQGSLDNASVIESPPSSAEDVHRIESFFGSVNYALDNKYLLSASLRTDGSSRFAPDVRWGQFYSFGAAWRIKQESFMDNIRWLDDLKLKVSYGESGNDNIGLFYQYRFFYFADGNGNFTVPRRVSNPDLKWEGNKNLNYGFEFAMLKRRFTGSVEFFSRISDDLLFDFQLPTSTGFSNIFRNTGESKNYGVEIQLAYNVIQKKDFDWRIDFNITHFKNVVTRLPDEYREKGAPPSGLNKLSEGRSIYDFYTREFAGVDPATGLALYYRNVLNADGKPTGERQLTSDINRADFYYVGATAIPDFNGGITNSIRYKSFQFSVLTTYSYGGHFYDGNYQTLMHFGRPGSHWHRDILDRWQKPGDITNVPRIQQGLDDSQSGASSRFLFDASYLNIKNITFSYDCSSILSKKTFIKDAQFFVSMDNAYIFTAKSGGDPQQSFGGGVSSTAYPLFRTITFGTTFKL
jgi:TonB-linked SusC/RagA family outer membrane protein